jgi:hypothetical protein
LTALLNDAVLLMNQEVKTESMDVVEGEDQSDEYVDSFDQLDASPLTSNKLQDFLLLLKNERMDDQAIKIKEQCIYRLVCLAVLVFVV